MKRPRPQAVWPWDEVVLTSHEVSALKGVSDAALAAIEKLAGNRNPFAAGGPEGARATDFACGKLWLAAAIRNGRAVKLPESREPRAKGERADPHAVPRGEPPKS